MHFNGNLVHAAVWRGFVFALEPSKTSQKSAGPKRGCLNVGACNPQESGRKAPLSCNAAFSMLQCSFSFAAAQLLVQMTSALQKSRCCSAVSAVQHSENCKPTSVFACGMLQGWGLEGWGLGLAEKNLAEAIEPSKPRRSNQTPQSSHQPHKRHDEHCQRNPGVVYIWMFSYRRS